jgi:hypothetical protein
VGFLQHYLSVDCIDPYRLGKRRIFIDERAGFRQRDHRQAKRALFVSIGEGVADLGCYRKSLEGVNGGPWSIWTVPLVFVRIKLK